jgi:hypothetical protein
VLRWPFPAAVAVTFAVCELLSLRALRRRICGCIKALAQARRRDRSMTLLVGDEPVSITFVMPPAGNKPSEFRRALIVAIRAAIGAAHHAGELDAPRAVESFRVLAVEELRR